jgi:hypothetical protein
MRLVVEFMTVEAPLKRLIDIGGGPCCTAALDVPAGAAWRRMCLRRTRPRNVSWRFVTRYEQHNTALKRSFHHQKVSIDVGVVVEIGANELAFRMLLSCDSPAREKAFAKEPLSEMSEDHIHCSEHIRRRYNRASTKRSIQ